MHPGKALILVSLGSVLAMVPVIIALGFWFAGPDDYDGGPDQDDGLRFELTFGDGGENLEQLDDERRELEERFDEDLRDVEERFEEERRDVEERFEEERRDVEERFEEERRDIEERFDEELLEEGVQPESPGESAELDEPAG